MMTVSIVIPVYNTEKYLVACIESCLSQSYKNIEIILIDDGSTDSSRKILLEYKCKDPRIRVIEKENEGVAIARHDALKIASGEWVLFLDSDDYLLPNSVEVLVENAEIADLVVGTYWEEEENSKYKRYYALPSQGAVSSQEYLCNILTKKVRWSLLGILIKRLLLEDVIMPPFRVGEDAAVLVQLICRAENVCFIQNPVYVYLQRVGSAIHTRSAQNLIDILCFRMWIRDYLVQVGSNVTQQQMADFIADGFSECLLLGGYRYISLKYKYDLQNLDMSRLALWQMILVRAYSISPYLGTGVRFLLWNAKEILVFFKRTFSINRRD